MWSFWLTFQHVIRLLFSAAQISTSSETPRSNKTAGAFMFSLFFAGRGNVLGKYETTMWKDIGELTQPQKKLPNRPRHKKRYIRHSSEWWNGGSVWCIWQRSRPFQGAKRMVQQLEDDPMDVADVSLLWNECCLHKIQKVLKKGHCSKYWFRWQAKK